jgi:pantoate--beta-alanine ligase
MANSTLRGQTGTPQVVTDAGTLSQILRAARAAGKIIGLVPTMGALHAGHLSLVRASVTACDLTVVTIFVNPAQFGPTEDFARYPRTLDHDVQLLGRARADVVFAPTTDHIYRAGFSTYVEPPDVAKPLEGGCRPGHFRGVATIVLKLFHLVPADRAFFGQKDYQQVRVIQTMVADLDVPIRVVVCPTVREPDGLAMSSRNRYLSAAERRQALALSHSLARAAELVRSGERSAATIHKEMSAILETAGITRVDYVALVDPVTLGDVAQVQDGTMALVAAYVGGTRLIDNRQLGAE